MAHIHGVLGSLQLPGTGFLNTINGRWHKQAMLIFLAIVLAHWAEHLLQAGQVWLLDWPRPASKGALGLVFPWLVTSEALHYGYAIVMLIGLLVCRPAFVGRARMFWNLALGIQFWHHFEHALLLGQFVAGTNLFGSPVPVSILQLVIPRVELHLFYNGIVFAPMLVAMYYHAFPPRGETWPSCNCHGYPAHAQERA
jgi:hypothetical protein